ncbi:MAG: hypothetical protein IT209_00675 [Armatimonadetes bacterium]|nr:hypothetical protein [Armatimonadota bacterium]
MSEQKVIARILDTAAARAGDKGATERQCWLLAKLILEEGGNGNEFINGALTKRQASEMIDISMKALSRF